MSHESSPSSLRRTAFLLASVVALYVACAVTGTPSFIFNATHENHHDSSAGHQHSPASEHDEEEEEEDDETAFELWPASSADDGQRARPRRKAPKAGPAQTAVPPPVWMIAPFASLLLAIALFPLIPATEHWWEKNSHRFYVAAGLGVLTLLYYLLLHPHPVEGHWPTHHLVIPGDHVIHYELAWEVFANAILYEFVPFIVLLFTLYTISGGIRIEGDLRPHPTTNATIMCVGALLASFVGTTGAAMLLIRPLLETNHHRRHVAHTVIFFIFIVCNCGGCLLPIGDPPLFLGYLRGVDFLWTFKLWPMWATVNLSLLAVYWLADHFYYYPRENQALMQHDDELAHGLRFRGVGLNGLLLGGVVLSVALLDPSKTLPGTDWHPWMYLRETVQIGLVAVSLGLGSLEVRAANRFDFHAILEVAALFSGIFICMQPALQILETMGPQLGITAPMAYFWITGGLSAILDNAPTYVVFFELARTVSEEGPNTVARVHEPLLVAISLGAVFMGAMTYIGNGPNFMVKAIAETSGVRMPSFFGYIVYSALILLPILWIMSRVFL